MDHKLCANANKNSIEIGDVRKTLKISVLIPCLNEELTVSRVLSDFQVALPQADIYVYDNNSTDGTALVAVEAGALVRHEPFRGKGNVVRRMFSDVEADIYVLVDGDDTYNAAIAPEVIDLLLRCQLDMVNVARVTSEGIAYRRGHREPRRFCRRLQTLRGWSHGNEEDLSEILT